VRVSRDGQLLPEVKQVIAVIAKHNLVMATGHPTPEEALMMIREARAQGVKHMVVTHAMIAPIHMSDAQMLEAAKMGAYIEFVYNGLIGSAKEFTFKDYARAIRYVGVEHCILSPATWGSPRILCTRMAWSRCSMASKKKESPMPRSAAWRRKTPLACSAWNSRHHGRHSAAHHGLHRPGNSRQVHSAPGHHRFYQRHCASDRIHPDQRLFGAADTASAQRVLVPNEDAAPFCRDYTVADRHCISNFTCDHSALATFDQAGSRIHRCTVFGNYCCHCFSFPH
jgi:hypothetical protein